MAKALLTQSELLEWTGYSRQADLEKFLRVNRVNYTYGKEGKVCTTQSAVDSAMIPANENVKEVAF